jgi:hypothetical protein
MAQSYMAKVCHEIQKQKLNKIRLHAVNVAFTCNCRRHGIHQLVCNAGYLYNDVLHLLHVALQYCRRSELRKNGH